jgi:hypothetical protein
MSRTPTDWAVWLPKAFFLNWSDKTSRERNMSDPTIWLPLGLFPPIERERLVNNYYGNYVSGNYIEEGRVMGDKFDKVIDSTIINKSLVENAFNKVKAEHGDDVSNALAQVADFIQKSKEPTVPAAAALLDGFNQELTKTTPDKSRLKSIWDGIEKVLPSISTTAGVVDKIVPLFT